MSDGRWAVRLRDDQIDTLIQVLDYVIKKHGERIVHRDVIGIDQFAHESSRVRLAEVHKHLVSIRD